MLWVECLWLFTHGVMIGFGLFRHGNGKQPLLKESNTRGDIMKKEYDFSNAKRGALDPLPKGKTRITIRIDDDVLSWFRNVVESQGGGTEV